MAIERAADEPAAIPRGDTADGGTGWWCNRCGQPMRLVGGDDVPVALRKALHAATGAEKGVPDSHIAAPIGYEPPLWQAARELDAETGGLFSVSARFGFLRADWMNLGPGVVAAHYTADGKAEMRLKLRRDLIQAGLGQDTPIMRGAPADR